MSRPMDCIVIFKSILYLDDVIPLIFELKHAGIVKRPLFATARTGTYEYLRKNIVLCDAIESLGGKLVDLTRFRNRYLNQLFNLFVLRRYFYKKVLSFETYKQGVYIVTKLAPLNRRLLGGKRLMAMLFNTPFEEAMNDRIYGRLVRSNFDVRDRTILGYDRIVLSHSKEQFEEIYNSKLTCDCPVLQVGYTRGLPQWRAYLERHKDSYLPADIRGPYFFFNLNRVERWIPGEDCAASDQLLRESLTVLKEFNDEIVTVFKPHNNTKVELVHELLRSVGYRNYVISYVHPWILMRKAQFVFSYTASTISVDGYFLGKPTVEYADYDSRFLKHNGERSVFLDCVDYFVLRDKEKLRQVIADLVRGNGNGLNRRPEKLREGFAVIDPDVLNRELCWGKC